MAILTGQCDALPCFLRSVGVDAEEFTGPDGGGRVHVYRGAGPGPDLGGGGGGAAGDCTGAGGPCPLWSTKPELERYDTVLLGCECGPHDETKPDKTPMHDWVNEGGRLIAIHDQSTWLENGPADFQAVATWVAGPSAGVTGPFQVDTSSVPGTDLQEWLVALGVIGADGNLPLDPADVATSVWSVGAAATPWVIDSSQSWANVKSFSFLPHGIVTPGGTYSGRVTFSDVHVEGGGRASSAPVPARCSGWLLTAGGKALEYAFFDSVQCFPSRSPLPSPPPPSGVEPDAAPDDGGGTDAPTSE